jgi:hypothetical protein
MSAKTLKWIGSLRVRALYLGASDVVSSNPNRRFAA